MYLCGHPGTGKTSTLHKVLATLKANERHESIYENLDIFLYNAMSFKDVKRFCIRLLSDLTEKLVGEVIDDEHFKDKKYDEEDLSLKIAKVLQNKSKFTKIIVIDEIDSFESNERGFMALVKNIIVSKSNTILIGIANSVDLPFKKKHSAIALRDSQLLFEPYKEDQIIEILEKKINLKFQFLPQQIRDDSSIKSAFFSIVEAKAFSLIAKRVSKMNGDLRVAFDILKSCFVDIQS